MCQFAKAYPLRALQSFIETDASLSVPTIQSVTNEVLKLNDKQFTQELTAQIQSIDCQSLAITQEVPAQFEDVGKTVSAIYRMGIREIEEVFLTSPIAKINWTISQIKPVGRTASLFNVIRISWIRQITNKNIDIKNRP